MTHGQSLERFPAHLGLGAKVLPQPEFTGMEWYEAYAARTAGDGTEGRLVSLYSFTEDWTSWEMHPAGDEMVVCTAGSISLLQEMPDGRPWHAASAALMFRAYERPDRTATNRDNFASRRHNRATVGA